MTDDAPRRPSLLVVTTFGGCPFDLWGCCLQVDIQQTKEESLSRGDVADLCRELALEPNDKGKVARCPAHKDEGRPNLAIYPDGVHCFVCGFHADAFALIGKVKGLDFRGSFNFLA